MSDIESFGGMVAIIIVVVCFSPLIAAVITYEQFESEYTSGTITNAYIASDGSKYYSDYFIVLDNKFTYELSQDDWGIISMGDFVELESLYGGTWKIVTEDS